MRRPEAVERVALVRAGGTVEARESIETGFQIAGRIRRVAVEEGQSVRVGQLLAELDPTDYQYGVDIAAGEAAAAQALADKAKAAPAARSWPRRAPPLNRPMTNTAG